MASNVQSNIQHEVKDCNEKLKLKTEECDILRKQLTNLEEELRRKNESNIQHEEQFEVKESNGCNEKSKLKTAENEVLRKQLRNVEEELRRKNEQSRKHNDDIQQIKGLVVDLESRMRCDVESKSQDESITVMGLSPSMLTDKQRDIFNNYKNVIIHGVAGSGKTTLILLKIIELAKMGSQKILLLAQSPHHLRCQKILESNNVTVNVVNEFPSIPLYSPLNSSVVLVMTPDDYFSSCGEQLDRLFRAIYAEFHIFVDNLDTRSTIVGRSEMTYDEIGNYFLKTQRPTHYLWIGIDPTNDRTPELNLLHEREKELERNRMPLYHLKEVVRDTTDKIVRLCAELRKNEIGSDPKRASYIPKNIEVGPTIWSDPLMFHMLKATKDDDHASYTSKLKEFYEERIDEELDMLLSQSPTLKPSDIAIIFDTEDDLNHPDLGVILVDRCLKKHSKNKQTILEQICHNDVDKVIVDVSQNMASFDCSAIIHLINERITYREVKSKRSLTIIYRNYWRRNDPYRRNNTCLVKWQRIDDSFCKMTESRSSSSSS